MDSNENELDAIERKQKKPLWKEAGGDVEVVDAQGRFSGWISLEPVLNSKKGSAECYSGALFAPRPSPLGPIIRQNLVMIAD